MKILSIKSAIPMATGVIVTCDRYTPEETTQDGVEDVSMTGRIKELQTVVSPSASAIARGVNKNNVVAISYENYKKSKNVANHSFGVDEQFKKEFYYEMPVIMYGGVEHMLIDVNDIELIVDDYEYVDFE